MFIAEGTEWREGLRSKALVAQIYQYFETTYGMDRRRTDAILNLHNRFNTYVVIDGKGYARYNIEGTVAYIMDCIVIEGGSQTLRRMCKLGRDKFPYAKTIRFERLLKKRKNMRHFKLKDFIKEVL